MPKRVRALRNGGARGRMEGQRELLDVLRGRTFDDLHEHQPRARAFRRTDGESRVQMLSKELGVSLVQAETAALLRRLNRERGVTILLVSHDLNLAAEVCDRLLLLAAGRQVAVGAPQAVLSETLLAAAFGCEVTVEKHPATRRPVVQPTWRVDGPRPGGRDTPTTKGGGERSRASE